MQNQGICMAFAYITCKNKREAQRISDYLIKKRIAACTNSFPIESSFRWKGKITHQSEYAILAKTTKPRFKSILGQVSKIHSYDLPCICLLPSTSGAKFAHWVKK